MKLIVHGRLLFHQINNNDCYVYISIFQSKAIVDCFTFGIDSRVL